MDHFHFKKIHGVGFCGGAAALIRTISKHPDRFCSHHIFHNSIISSIPLEFETNIKKYNMKIWVSWCEDQDHLRHSVGYKYFNSKRKEKSSNIFLEDIKNDDLPGAIAWSHKMGRNTDYVEIFDVSKGYSDFVIEFFNGKKISFRSNLTFTGAEYENLDFLVDAPLEKTAEELENEIILAITLSLTMNEN